MKSQKSTRQVWKNKIPGMRHLSDSNGEGEDGEVIWLLGKYLCGERNPFRRGFFHHTEKNQCDLERGRLQARTNCKGKQHALYFTLPLNQGWISLWKRVFTGHQLLESIPGTVEWNLITCDIGVLSKMILWPQSPHILGMRKSRVLYSNGNRTRDQIQEGQSNDVRAVRMSSALLCTFYT